MCTAEGVSFGLSHHRISSIDSKLQANPKNSIIHRGKERRKHDLMIYMSTETSAVKQFSLKSKAIFPIPGIISVNVLTLSLKPCGFVVVFFCGQARRRNEEDYSNCS